MSTLRVNTIQNSGGTGSPEINGLARAWVNFNGTGTVAIRASSNVSSITDNGTGDYTLNFTTAMPDANYVPTLTVLNTVSSDYGNANQVGPSLSVSQFRLATFQTSGAFADVAGVYVAIFR
jgi:hypothetical protein